jgi:hypothetical protein
MLPYNPGSFKPVVLHRQLAQQTVLTPVLAPTASSPFLFNLAMIAVSSAAVWGGLRIATGNKKITLPKFTGWFILAEGALFGLIGLASIILPSVALPVKVTVKGY